VNAARRSVIHVCSFQCRTYRSRVA
jgi:hypothetical protein